MAFKRDAISWDRLYAPVAGGGGWKSTLLKDLTDQQIQNVIGNQRNKGALASGWALGTGGVVRAPQTQAGRLSGVLPQAPGSAVGNRPIPGKTPTGQQPAMQITKRPAPPPAPKDGFNRAAVDPFLNVIADGKWDTVSVNRLTPQQILAALKNGRNVGGTADGWRFENGKVIRWPQPPKAGTTRPTTPAPTQRGDVGYFFNPWSETLWSRYYVDPNTGERKFLLNADQPSGNAQLATEFDPQYAIAGGGRGNLPGNMDIKDAGFFLDQAGSRYELMNRLRPFQSKMDELGQKFGGRTRYDIEKDNWRDQFEDKSAATYGNMAARGIYNSGARSNAYADLSMENANKLLGLNMEYGDLAKQDVKTGMENARMEFAGQVYQMLLDAMNRKQQQAVMDALGR